MARRLEYDHYRLLGVPRDASAVRIKQAYRNLVMKYHPDRNPSPGTSEVFAAITDAYRTLADPSSRKSYDDRLRFYRPSNGDVEEPRIRYPRKRKNDDGPATRSFAALHIVGMLFGTLVGVCSLIGILKNGWPLYSFLFCLPSMLILPDAYNGLRKAIRSWS